MTTAPSGFRSFLADDLNAFLAFKRSRGNPYRRAEFTLRSFDRFAAAHVLDDDVQLDVLFLSWLATMKGRKPVSVANEVGVIRQFYKFLRRRDPATFVPGRTWAPQSTQSNFLPHIFTEKEVQKLLSLACSLSGPPIRAAAFHTLLLILYCTGLRVGEAVRLQLRDVDLSLATFMIAPSKGRSRIVPFGLDLRHEVNTFLAVRAGYADSEGSRRLFVRADGTPLTVRNASDTIRTLLRRAGLKSRKGRTGPRLYDFRHTFAVHRLTRWYSEGVDIHACLPWLSAYMGHYNILGTEAYLHATPELLALVGGRFERHFTSVAP